MEDNKKKTIFISIITVALFIVAIISVSYAFFTAKVKNEGTGKTETSLSTANISLNFQDGPELNYPNMIPGDSFTKTFTLKNTGDKAVNYKVVIQEVENTFISKGDIAISLKEGSTVLKNTTFPSTTSAISDTITIQPNVTKSYTLTITYNNTAADQTPDMGKVISGKLFIEEV